MNAYTTVCIVNVSIALAIGVACYATGSGLPLFALFFLMSTSNGKDD